MKSNDISSLIALLSKEKAEKDEYKQWLANANEQIAIQSNTIKVQSNSITSLQKLLAEQYPLIAVGA
ncbi:hypothetical protein GOC13_24510 [Sinorhizobium meliloti]|nr:hypothetical protein [Sinorhizobium meliloti]